VITKRNSGDSTSAIAPNEIDQTIPHNIEDRNQGTTSLPRLFRSQYTIYAGKTAPNNIINPAILGVRKLIIGGMYMVIEYLAGSKYFHHIYLYPRGSQSPRALIQYKILVV